MRGYHAYQGIWDADLGEQLPCQREPMNTKDPFAVAVVKSQVTVGHIPRKISSICSMFLRHGGTINCRVTASRRYSRDLPQGGLEIPCVLTFRGGAKDIAKVSKLVSCALSLRPEAATGKDEPPKKKIMCDTQDGSVGETEGIISGEKLSDLHINFAQSLLKLQFPWVNGLQNTLLQSKNNPDKPLQDQLQVIHCCTRDHWIVASTVNCKDGEVNIYDYVYSTVDEETDKVLANLFHYSSSVKVMQTQKQVGGNDCGLFAIAIAIAIAFGADPTKLLFDQVAMRSHLVQCFTDKVMKLFPVSC